MPKISFISRLTDIIAPRRCPVCDNRLSVVEEHICTVCNLRMPRTGHVDNPADNDMARIFYGKIPVMKCAALIFYEAQSQADNLIYKLKYSNRPEICETLGSIVARELMPCEFFKGVDVVIPIPITRARKRQRGYNQSMEIARGISRVTGLPIEKKTVKRLSFTRSQTKMGFRERMENVENAFKLTGTNRVRGKHVLIVDDVVTTGATITACARQLLKAGDVKISVISIAFTKN